MPTTRYDVDEVALQGRADVGAAITKAAKGDKVLLVVEASFRAFEDSSPAHRGDIVVGKARVGDVLVLSGEEYDEFMGRIGELRSERERPGQSTIDDGIDDEYSHQKRLNLVALCKERGLSASGNRAELLQRLRDNG